MTQAQLKEKVLNIEAQLLSVKKTLTRAPRFVVDEENWRKVKQEIKKNRKNLYKKLYGKR